MNRESALARIVELNDFQRMICTSSNPGQGQFVVTGPNFKGDHGRVGYCVQVRKRVGQFGSDMVLLRHADDSLVVQLLLRYERRAGGAGALCFQITARGRGIR